MRALVFSLLLVMLALAGCADQEPTTVEPTQEDPEIAEDAGDEETDGSEEQDTPEQPDEPVDEPEPAKSNMVPVASLQASALEGEAPLNVTFDINGTDEDGDALSWTLDVDDDGVADYEGESVPANVSHVFGVGNHSVTLTVDDGTNSTTTSLTVAATEVIDPRTFFSGTVTTRCSSCTSVGAAGFGLLGTGAVYCDGFRGGTQGEQCIWFEVPSELAGQPFLVTSTGGDPDGEWRKSCDLTETDPAAQAGTAVLGENILGSDGAESGTVPEGMSCLILWEWADAVPSEITAVIG